MIYNHIVTWTAFAILAMFFHSLPVPELRELFFSIPFLFPNFGNGIMHSGSCSRTPKCHSRSPLIPAKVFIN